MAIITATVTKNSAPLNQATLIIGDVVSGGLTTNESGQVTKTVAEDFKVYVPITVLHDSLEGGRRDFGDFLLEAGGSYTFNA